MSISAKVIEDSISEAGVRLTTLQIEYPRFFHQEMMTHRQFSRNASSSRAIPVKKMIKDVWTNPALPVHWGSNQPGMQAHKELTGWRRSAVQKLWRLSSKVDCLLAWAMMKCGAHKQVVNRVLEPAQHIRVVLSSTQWSNFMALRDHPDAQPEIRVLAQRMAAAMGWSEPKLLKEGEWHLPYITDEERQMFDIEELKMASAARCARVSYNLHDGSATNLDKDLDLFMKLAGSQPIHASPLEHQATPDSYYKKTKRWRKPYLHGNYTGWQQHRKMLPGECQ